MRKTFIKIENSCGDLSLDINDYAISNLKDKAVDVNRKHPSPEQLLMRQALKYLTVKQRQVWEYYNYDRLSQDEIADSSKSHNKRFKSTLRRAKSV